MTPRKKKVDEIDRFITDCELMSGEQMRRRLRALVRGEILKCLTHLMNYGCNENAQSAYELWVKAGRR